MKYLAINVVLLALCAPAISRAEPITVRILNGRNGKPIHGVRTYVSFDGKPNEVDQILDKSGTVTLQPQNYKTVRVSPVGTVSCGEQRTGQPALDYSLGEVSTRGYVSPNDCGHNKVYPHAGELVIYVRYATAWELFRN